MICMGVDGVKRALFKVIIPLSVTGLWLITCYPGDMGTYQHFHRQLLDKKSKSRGSRYMVAPLSDGGVKMVEEKCNWKWSDIF